MPITAERCVALLQDELSHRPADTYSEEALDWFARVAGIVSAYNGTSAVRLNSLLPRISGTTAGIQGPVFANARADACTQFFTEARTLHTQLQLETNSFMTRHVGQGEVHDYFEEIRGIVARATQDILFIDPYIDAEFVTRYMPQVPQGVNVRLLTAERQTAGIGPSLALYRQQHAVQVELRVLPNRSLHDRHLIIDGRDVYQSGASFKDGARNAPTSINQIVDVAVQMIREHEARWAEAQVP